MDQYSHSSACKTWSWNESLGPANARELLALALFPLTVRWSVGVFESAQQNLYSQMQPIKAVSRPGCNVFALIEAFACHIRWPDGPIWPKHPLLQLYHWFFFQSCGTCVFPDADATLAFGVAPCHQSVCKTAGGGRKPKHMSNVRMMICFRGATCACKIKISKSYACDAAVMRLCSQFLSFVSLIMAESTMDA